MPTTIEIWRSVTGIDPADFVLLPPVTDGNPFQALDTPVVPGQLYIYKARRRDTASGLYSDFSPLAYVRGPYPGGNMSGTTPNTTTPSGIQSKLGIGIQATPAGAVKAARLLDRTQGSMDTEIKRIKRKAVHNHAGTVGHVNGVSETMGQLSIEVTPESCDEMFCSFAGAPTTVPVSGPTAPAAPTAVIIGAAGAGNASYAIIASNAQGDSAASTALVVNTVPTALSAANAVQVNISPVAGATLYKVLKGGQLLGITNTLSLIDQGQPTVAYVAPAAPVGNVQTYLVGMPSRPTLPVSILDHRGNSIFLFGGCVTDKLGLSFDKGQQEPFTLTADMKALYEVVGYTEAQLGLDTAGTDPLGAYGVAPGCQMLIAGAACDVQKFTSTLDGAQTEKQTLSGFMGPNSFFRQGSAHSVSATAYFSSESEMDRYFGVVSPVGPYGLQNQVIYFPIYLVVSNPPNAAGIVNQFILQLPYATYEKVGQPYKGKDAIMQELTIYPDIDLVSGTDAIIQTVNSRTNAGIITPGTLVTPVPGNGQYSYTN